MYQALYMGIVVRMGTDIKVTTTTRRTARITSTVEAPGAGEFRAVMNVRTARIVNPGGWSLEFPRTAEHLEAFYDLASVMWQEHLQAQAVLWKAGQS